ncbi:hypothetical protein M422DRAFT_275450 [Sphaerobolus stellatus SS14]|uniref:Uncharacterized protein n=1 Tax=Sphaerobolus stellatus (strain SS14) TaxID=990650 RepID=A0A0C9UEK9_SPHS4|nr:hypothetical protein M422DRAFT_275450 [Sphaerobolus stellatus SS14]
MGVMVPEAKHDADKVKGLFLLRLEGLARDGLDDFDSEADGGFADASGDGLAPGPVDTTAGGLMAAVGHCGLVGFEVIVVLHDGVDALSVEGAARELGDDGRDGGELEAGVGLALGHMGLSGDSGSDDGGGE